jgi:hypothetical protein
MPKIRVASFCLFGFRDNTRSLEYAGRQRWGLSTSNGRGALHAQDAVWRAMRASRVCPCSPANTSLLCVFLHSDCRLFCKQLKSQRGYRSPDCDSAVISEQLSNQAMTGMRKRPSLSDQQKRGEDCDQARRELLNTIDTEGYELHLSSTTTRPLACRPCIFNASSQAA